MAHDEPLAPTPGPSGAPVFVDASGRRAKRIERIAAIVVLACIGYGLALLIAALTGVPIQGAILPYPALGSTSHANRPSDNPTNPPAGGPTAGATSGGGPSSSASTGATSSSSATSTRSVKGSATATAKATHPSATPTAKPTATAHGKSTSAPGATNRPTAKPTPTAHGRALHP